MNRSLFLLPAAALLAGCPSPQKPRPDDVVPDAAVVARAALVEPDALSVAPAPQLPHLPPGVLLPRTAKGFLDAGHAGTAVAAPEIRFPLLEGPAFANSQIFNAGGFGYKYTTTEIYPGPEGEENVPSNFDYPWRDNFCEVRNAITFLCPSGHGHRGQDIRPATCKTETYWIVAPERSEVKWIKDNTVLLYGKDTGNVYTLLHMDAAKIEPRVVAGLEDQSIEIARGEKIARVSNFYAGPNGTTTHLHFEIIQGGLRHGENKGGQTQSPYTSLIEAYLDLTAENPDRFDPVPQPAGRDTVACKAAP